MLTDLNISNSTNEIQITNTIGLFIQEIEMIILTPRTSVLGKTNLGLSIYDLLYTYKLNSAELEQRISTQIEEFSFFKKFFDYKIRISFFRGSIRDIGLIDIIIDDPSSGEIIKTIKIQ